VEAAQREYVVRMQASSTATEEITIYADALAMLPLPRTAPLLASLWSAGEADPECRQVYKTITERRAANMRLLAADERRRGRHDLATSTTSTTTWLRRSCGG
jgi:hypothetical protein